MTRSFVLLLLLLLAAVAWTPLAAGAPTIRPDDQARLDGLDAAAGQALRQVLAEGSDADVSAAVEVLRGAAGPAAPSAAEALTGDWACRMTKIGGNMALVAYPAFRCRIEARGGVLHFDKQTGSQRTSGTLHARDGRWVYLGSAFVQGDTPRAYADFPAEIDVNAGETLPDVGVLEVTGPGRARLVLPLPYRESVLNVLTLTR